MALLRRRFIVDVNEGDHSHRHLSGRVQAEPGHEEEEKEKKDQETKSTKRPK